ncbi:MAG: 4-hydroxy-tetrahydrodipicolinate reductase [Coxiella sp. (in: Bacteria)]|nr:MAG: 4-hydroxy-tetrahydrodipicolinate reductase [Coxiella sp. (in: g-proteobacteria)]
MVTRVLVTGAHGKMGTLSVDAIQQAPTLELVGTCSSADNLSELLITHQPDVVVDFTLPHCVFDIAKTCIEHNACPVIGTSGLTDTQLDELKTRCDAKKLGGLFAPNFSLGAVLMMTYAQDAATYFKHAEIIELHHDKKVDAPSGTAVHTRNKIGRDTPIHSVRLPGLLAHQEVIFGAPGETLTIRHDALDRKCMMPGVVLACEKVIQLKTFVVGLDAIL